MDARERDIVEQIAAMRVDLATLSAELRAFLARVDPSIADHEKRIRALEQRPQVEDLPERMRAVERWQWQREALLTLSGGGVGAAVVTALSQMWGGG